MIVGKVINRVVSTRKYQELQGYKLLVIQPCYGSKELFVAADTMGAGQGEFVLVSTGEAVQHALTRSAPIDAIVVGILDNDPSTLEEGR
ncbi:EutN/CcmL family microcompartment protein [Bacillaceae bacterium IKA-2]|jgi:ethanolamine utilization protein EutN|nr:EutN/CcmL family microcompartment protein [Bacillaceae bacterium IKA-2]